jgi:hypothetical protein
VSDAASSRRPAYSPDLRTAIVLTGTGADGGYHAGVLRALQEAGIRIDVFAGHGIGAVGALFGSIDGVGRLHGPSGLWRSRRVRHLYAWRPTLRAMGWTLLAGAALLTVPVVLLALGLLVYELSIVLDLAGPGTAQWLASRYAAWVDIAFRPTALPTWIPRLALVLVACEVGLVLVASWQVRRGRKARTRDRGGVWWNVLGAPMTSDAAATYFETGLWNLLRGGAAVRQPDRSDLGRRVAELLTDNLGQPGFRELLLVTHDLDARRDLVFALLGPEHRRNFFLRKPVLTGDRRSAEAFDLAGVARDHTLHAVAGALALPVVCEPELLVFSSESYWRGEAHRLCDRPEVLMRLLEEVASAGVRQVVLVTASSDPTGPHGLSTRRVSPRARLSEFLGTAGSAALRDSIAAARPWFDALFLVRPAHNPLGPLDLAGAFDERSDRHHPLGESIDRGYEDAYRQFIEPVVGASGEALEAETSQIVD